LIALITDKNKYFIILHSSNSIMHDEVLINNIRFHLHENGEVNSTEPINFIFYPLKLFPYLDMKIQKIYP